MSVKASATSTISLFFIASFNSFNSSSIKSILNCTILFSGNSAFSFITFGCFIQNPDTYGEIHDLESYISKNKSLEIISIVAADIMSMVIMKSPGSFNADIVIGSSQRFGVPMGLGGPHAAFFATKDEFKRLMPGRLIGVSVSIYNFY